MPEFVTLGFVLLLACVLLLVGTYTLAAVLGKAPAFTSAVRRAAKQYRAAPRYLKLLVPIVAVAVATLICVALLNAFPNLTDGLFRPVAILLF